MDQTPSYQSPQQSNAPHSSSPSPRRKLRLIVGGACLVVAIVVVALWLLPGKKSNKTTAPKTNDSLITSLAGQSLSADTVKNINKEETFYAYLKSAAQQQKLIVTKEFYFTDNPDEQPTSKIYTQTGFDYKTKQFVKAKDDLIMATNERDKLRCVDGKELYKLAVIPEWKEADVKTTIDCRFETTVASTLNDGFNTGGLTGSQAEAFVGYLRSQKGLLAVRNLTLEDHKGKQYLHFSVDLSPILYNKLGYLGNQWLQFAFSKTGLDSRKHPYTYIGAGGDGLHIEYFVDPATKLPAYSVLTTAPKKDDTGRDLPVSGYYQYRVTYQFGTAIFDASITNNTDVHLDW